MQNVLPKEHKTTEEDFELSTFEEKTGWLLLLFFGLPWLLGIGVIGIWVINLLGIRF